MSTSKAELVKQGNKLGIKGAKDIPYAQLAKMIRIIKNNKSISSSSSSSVKKSSTVKSSVGLPGYVQPSGIPEQLLPGPYGISVEFFKDSWDEWRWHVRGKNHKIMADSGEGYKTKWSAKRGFKKVMGL